MHFFLKSYFCRNILWIFLNFIQDAKNDILTYIEPIYMYLEKSLVSQRGQNWTDAGGSMLTQTQVDLELMGKLSLRNIRNDLFP
jgi:hypothetical protein